MSEILTTATPHSYAEGDRVVITDPHGKGWLVQPLSVTATTITLRPPLWKRIRAFLAPPLR